MVNNQATPVPIELDGQARQVTVPLERIASLGTAAGYELQLIPQTTMYDAQRATGVVQVESAKIELPLTAPAGTAPSSAPPQDAAPKGKAKPKKKCKAKKPKRKKKCKKRKRR